MREVKGIVDNVMVTIYEKAVKDEKASEKSETPVFKTAIYIKKKIPNSRDVYDQPLKSTDIEKYGELHEAFEKGEKVPLDGTPLDQWPQLDVTQIETLKAASVFTVQQLANMPETGMKRLPVGYMTLKSKAGKWLNMGLENETLRKEIEELRKEVEALKPKRGRPKGSKNKAA